MQPRITLISRIKSFFKVTANYANGTNGFVEQGPGRVFLSTTPAEAKLLSGAWKNFLRMAILFPLFAVMVSCGSWGWESIETDNEEQLNVFGLISLDDSVRSFVIVHKTLDTAGPDQIVVGKDTVHYQAYEWEDWETGETFYDTSWYDPPWIRTRYESRYIVKDAVVTIYDGAQEYQFIRAPAQDSNVEYRYYGDIYSDPAIYLNVDQSFIPQPETNYTLDISTPGGLTLTGSVQTPPRPQIIENNLADTLSIRNLFQVSWHYVGAYSAVVTTGRKNNAGEFWICGLEQSGIIQPEDTTWNSAIDSWCNDVSPEVDSISDMDIRLRLLDENYYKYFLATDDDVADVSNFLIGTGSIGAAYGVEGGFGVFGAISADWIHRIAVP
ncbi:MAG: DUF4249 family protein [Candidatus Marinimicrobia bacterium]|nr:DUF4249 family protein [Candidatus Neomarinimicrobiota bacterium]